MAFTDDFSAISDDESLDTQANWTATTNDFRGVNAGGAIEPTGDTDSVVRYTATTPANDQYAQAAVTVDAGTNDTAGIGVGVRWNTSAAMTGYWAVVNAAGSNNITINRWNAGTPSTLAQRTSAFSAGDVLKLDVSTTGGSQATLKVYKNGVQVGADIVDNAGGSFIASGQAAVCYSSSQSNGSSLDNFEGGDLSAAPTSVSWLPSASVSGRSRVVCVSTGMIPPESA